MAPRGGLAVALLGLAALAGCATSSAPESVRRAPEGAPGLEQVRSDPARYAGRTVRWGGEIVELRNEAEATWLEIVERPLGRGGEPAASDRSAGRFYARVPGFLEPATYATGRTVTVVGRLEGTVGGEIGDYDYEYPVVAVTDHYLWPLPPQQAPGAYYDPWYCDPWYYEPWSPWGWPGYRPPCR